MCNAMHMTNMMQLHNQHAIYTQMTVYAGGKKRCMSVALYNVMHAISHWLIIIPSISCRSSSGMATRERALRAM